MVSGLCLHTHQLQATGGLWGCVQSRYKPSKTRGSESVEPHRGLLGGKCSLCPPSTAPKMTQQPQAARGEGSSATPGEAAGSLRDAAMQQQHNNPPPAHLGGVRHLRPSSFTCNGRNYISQSSRSRCCWREELDQPQRCHSPVGTPETGLWGLRPVLPGGPGGGWECSGSGCAASSGLVFSADCFLWSKRP